MGARLIAFGLLTCAAFAFPLPWLDRPGTAALGLAFAALGAGRVAVAARPASHSPRGPALFPGARREAITPELEKALAGYGLGATRTGDDE